MTWGELVPALVEGERGVFFLIVLCALALACALALNARGLHLAIASPIQLRLPALPAALPRLKVDPLVWIVGLGLVLRLVMLGQSLWYDESFTLRMAQLPLEMWPGALLNDVHPGGFYFIVWLWHGLVGDAPALLRIIPLAFGLLQIVLVHRLALRLPTPVAPKRFALLAALIVAVLPAAIYYSSELRSYTVFTCVFLVALIGLLNERVWPFALAGIALPHLHNFGIIYAAALAACAVLYTTPRVLKALIPIAASCAFAFLLTRAQSGIIADGFWTYFTPFMVLTPFVQMTLYKIDNLTVILAFIPFVLVTLSSFWRGRGLFIQRNDLWFLLDRWQIVGALLFGIPAITALISIFWRPVFVARTFYPIIASLLPLILAQSLVFRPRLRAVLFGALAFALAGLYIDGNSNTRVDYAGLVRTHCPTATSVYATGIAGAFVLNANVQLPLVVWQQADDDGGTFTADDLPIYGFTTAAQPPPGACIMSIRTPFTRPPEADYVASLRSAAAADSVTIGQYHSIQFIQEPA